MSFLAKQHKYSLVIKKKASKLHEKAPVAVVEKEGC